MKNLPKTKKDNKTVDQLTEKLAQVQECLKDQNTIVSGCDISSFYHRWVNKLLVRRADVFYNKRNKGR